MQNSCQSDKQQFKALLVLAAILLAGCGLPDYPFNKRVWRASDPRIKGKLTRVYMEKSVLQKLRPGQSKRFVTDLLGEPTCRVRKGEIDKGLEGYPDIFISDFDGEVSTLKTIVAKNGRRVPDPNDVEIWTYYLGQYDTTEMETIKIRFDRGGLVTKAYGFFM